MRYTVTVFSVYQFIFLVGKFIYMHITKIISGFCLSAGLIALCWLYSSHASKKAITKEQLIETVTNYSLTPMVERCKKEHGYTDEDMIILERELKRYFILSELNKSGFSMFSRDIDNLWHAFILFTKEYTHFCNSCFNRFVHHIPETEEFKARSPEKQQQSRVNFHEFVKLYEETFQEEIHSIWLLDMCEKQMEKDQEEALSS